MSFFALCLVLKQYCPHYLISLFLFLVFFIAGPQKRCYFFPGLTKMVLIQCVSTNVHLRQRNFMISGRNNSCSRMGLERKLCRLIPWDFRSPISSYQDPSLVHPGTKPQKILSLSLSLFRRSSKVVFTFIFCYPLEKFLFYALPPLSLFLSLSQVLKSSFYFHFLLSI